MKNERTKQGVTNMLYEEDAYLAVFSAKVIACEPLAEEKGEAKWAIVLDRTAFFPEGGGQDADRGTLNGQTVLDVQSEGGAVRHLVKEPLEIGAEVEARLDWEVRYRRMQNHSGEHLFCGIMNQKYGFENVGFHMGDDLITVDLDGFLSPEQLKEIEEEANRAIYANAPIYCVYPERADELVYRSKIDLEEEIRVVIIEGFDACACCAPHVKTTGEIGVLKVIDSMAHRGGVRITLKCGSSAYEDYALLQDEIVQIMRAFSAKRSECHLAAERVSAQLKIQMDTITALKKQITSLYIEKLHDSVAKEPGKREEIIFDSTLDDAQMRALLNEGVAIIPGIVAGFMGTDESGYRYIMAKNEAVAGEGLLLRDLARMMNETLGGRGGGSPKMIQGSVSAKKSEIEAFWKKEVMEYGA
ncbi:MAG: hypothetical protein E7288_01145 [Lachnospiraceae bacterium]|nr:hypothetical protein [Lachnospiraceae bacterium]